MQVTDEMVKALRRELKTFKPDDQLRSALTAALTAALSDKQAVEVKARPLNWTTEKKSGFTIHVGRGLGLKYEACIKAYSPGWVVTLGKSDVIFDGAEADEEYAKAAAQADYDQRIRSALVDVPAVEPVAWRHRLLGTQDWHVSNNTERDMKSARDYDQTFPGKLELEPLYTHPPHREGEDSAEVTAAIRNAGIKARDELLERMADGGSVDNDFADYMTRIIDACERAFIAATRSGSPNVSSGAGGGDA